jgi:hypothetical protein
MAMHVVAALHQVPSIRLPLQLTDAAKSTCSWNRSAQLVREVTCLAQTEAAECSQSTCSWNRSAQLVREVTCLAQTEAAECSNAARELQCHTPSRARCGLRAILACMVRWSRPGSCSCVSCSATHPHERDVVCVQSLHAWFDGHGQLFLCELQCHTPSRARCGLRAILACMVRWSRAVCKLFLCVHPVRSSVVSLAPDICARGMRIADLVQAQKARPSQSELDELRTVDPFTYASYSASGANGMCTSEHAQQPCCKCAAAAAHCAYMNVN